MTAQEIIMELESLATDLMKKRHANRGAKEPFFGVAVGAMKPLYKKVGINHALAEELYATGNYDVMYFAGMIADPSAMTIADFNRWMQSAYFHMISDFVVAVTLSESHCAMETADSWLDSENELCRSAAWCTYQWLLGWRPNDFFQKDKIAALLYKGLDVLDGETKHVKSSIDGFVSAVGISFTPLHEEAAKAAQTHNLPYAAKAIERIVSQGKVGFKRKAVRC